MVLEDVNNLSPDVTRDVARRLGIPSSIPFEDLVPEIVRHLEMTIPRQSNTGQGSGPISDAGNAMSSPSELTGGWHVDPHGGDAMWVAHHPKLDLIRVSSRSLIPLVQGKNTDGQQVTYILILRTRYSNSWADLTKVFNQIWNGPSYTIIPLIKSKFEHGKEHSDISQQEMERMWSEQKLYARDVPGMRAALTTLMEREDILVTFPDQECKIISRSSKAEALTDHIEACARDVNVVLVRV